MALRITKNSELNRFLILVPVKKKEKKKNRLRHLKPNQNSDVFIKLKMMTGRK